MPTLHRVFALIALTAAALSQNDAAATKKPPDARAFVPPTPVSEGMVDFKALRETGVWEALTRSFVSTVLPAAEQQLGFSLTRLDRLRAYGQRPKGPDALEGETIVIFESSDELDVPAATAGEQSKTDRIAGHEVTVRPSWRETDDPPVWVVPKKGVLVYGPRHLVAPVLEGTQTPGVTPPELLSLAAGRGVLAHFVGSIDIGTSTLLMRGLEVPATIVAPTFMMQRLRIDMPAAGPDETSHLHVESRLRWADGGDSPTQFAELLRTRLADLKKHPRFGALKRLWNLVEVATDARDVTIHIDLGSPREAGSLVMLAVPMLMMTTVTSETKVEVVPAAAPGEAAPTPQTDPAPAGGGEAPPPGNGRGGR